MNRCHQEVQNLINFGAHSLTLEVNLALGLSGTALAKQGHAVTLGARLFKARTALSQPHSPLAYTASVSSVAPSQSVRLHQCKRGEDQAFISCA